MTRSALAIATAALAGLAAQANAQLLVTPAGSFSPSGNILRPFGSIDNAAWRAGTGTVRANAGTYNESFLAPDGRVRIEAAPGRVVINGRDPIASTSLKVFCYNARLFGDSALGIQDWNDNPRASLVGSYLGIFGSELADTDIVALQEIWDEDYDDTIAALTISRFPHTFYGDANAGRPNNSGLMSLSRHPLIGAAQTVLDRGEGWDWFAAKGFTSKRIVKDGFGVFFINLHLQAGENSAEQSARFEQIVDLAAFYDGMRVLFQDHAFIIVGDFNVIGEEGEFFSTMDVLLNGRGLRDAAGNTPRTDDRLTCTSCLNNPVNQELNDPTKNKRLDYVLYANSFNGQVRVVPERFDVIRPQLGNGFELDDGSFTNVLSDHDAIVTTLRLERR